MQDFLHHYEQIQQPKRLIAFSARASEAFTGPGEMFKAL
jgi:hypothetical protein